MSASAPEVEAPEPAVAEKRGPLDGVDNEFLVSILTANATWSANIHSTALDGQERTSNEWAGRYLQLVRALGFLLADLPKWEYDSELFDRVDDLLGEQGFWPDFARDQIDRYRERLEKEKAERDGTPK